MSSSPSRARVPPAAPRPLPPSEALPFLYSEVSASAGPRNFLRTGESTPSSLGAQGAEREVQMRELGRQQGQLEAHAKFEQELARERAAVAQALADFARDRAAYYQKIEEE